MDGVLSTQLIVKTTAKSKITARLALAQHLSYFKETFSVNASSHKLTICVTIPKV